MLWRRPQPTVPACEYAPPVDAHAQRSAIQSGEPDPSTRKLLAAETSFILGKTKPEPYQRLRDDKSAPLRFAGLAFSGGGIRSATFNLGVLQAIAGAGLLGHFRYLSTVSGGGYIGSALTWWLGAGPRGNGRAKAPTFSTAPNRFPYGSEDPTDPDASRTQHPLLTFLRANGNYLTPGRGIDGWTAFAAVLRSITINIFTWGPVLVLCMYFANRGMGAIGRVTGLSWNPAIVVPLIFPALVILAFAFSIVQNAWISLLFAIGINPQTYLMSRQADIFNSRQFKWLIFACVVFSAPLVASLIPDGIGGITAIGPVALVGGIWSFVTGLRKMTEEGTSWISPKVLAGVGAGLLIYGVWISGYTLGTSLYLAVGPIEPSEFFAYLKRIVPFVPVTARADFANWSSNPTVAWVFLALGWDWVLFLVGLVWTLVFGLTVNINHLGLHRYYRDRLMEAFMPDFDRIGSDNVRPAMRAEQWPLAGVLSPPAPGKKLAQPYPLINTNLVLVKTTDRIRENRGGDSFVLSPLYCGSNATGWQSTREFLGGALTLPTAMAISGAAVNPEAGVGGTGPTRNRLVSWAMAWFNIRLGYWAPNPYKRLRFAPNPNHLVPGLLAELFFWTGYRERSTFVQLTDGGHFENLAVYELVRRRAGLIWCCDVGEDKDFTFDDLLNLLRRIETDFGARVEFAKDHQPAALAFRRDPGTRRVKKFASQGFLVGRIVYADQSEGTLIYVKATLIEKLRPEVLEYHAANPEFPDQSTADQWFDPDQFEAYRELGYALAKHALASAKVGRQSLTEAIGSFDRAWSGA